MAAACILLRNIFAKPFLRYFRECAILFHVLQRGVDLVNQFAASFAESKMRSLRLACFKSDFQVLFPDVFK